MKFLRQCHVATFLAVALAASAFASEKLSFEITLPDAAAKQPVSGRLFVFLSTRDRGEPRFGPSWFSPEPFFAADVKDFAPGESRAIDDAADGFPDKLSTLKAGKYRVQALLDHDFYEANQAQGAGNFYSKPEDVELDPAAGTVVKLTLDQVVEPHKFPASELVQEVEFKSELLSKFHRREVIDRCGVVLPKSYNDPEHDHSEERDRRYGVIYVVPGFGGNHRQASGYARMYLPQGEDDEEFIVVMLSGQCKWGHHVYADSATNGPRGQSLVEELIPLIDEKYRTVAEPTARFVTGHSSGGWSSLWLQVAYPDVFGGVWSTSPDPVDFRDFQQVDLYADPPLSLYRDEKGERRPIARRGEEPALWYDSFGKMDDVIGRGGQLRSFEAVFSPLDKDGQPARLWDRETGRIDPAVAEAWKKYDIRLRIEENWEQLQPKLAGKLHVVMGGLDTFYLDGAVRKLKVSLEERGSDAEVEIHEGKDHGSILSQEVQTKIRRQMAEAFRKHHPQGGRLTP
jgi:S-formylglutathione hydrolase FrmB